MIQFITQQIHIVIQPLTTHTSNLIMVITVDMIIMESMDIMKNITVNTESMVTNPAQLMSTHIHMMVSGTVTIMKALLITRTHTMLYTLSSLGSTTSTVVIILKMPMNITKVDSTKLTSTLITSYYEYSLLFL